MKQKSLLDPEFHSFIPKLSAYGNYVMCLNENCGSMETADIPKVELDRMMEKRLGYALIEPGCPEPQVFVDMFKCRDKYDQQFYICVKLQY